MGKARSRGTVRPSEGEVTGRGQDGREDGARLVFESSLVVKWKQRGESTVGSCGRGRSGVRVVRSATSGPKGPPLHHVLFLQATEMLSLCLQPWLGLRVLQGISNLPLDLLQQPLPEPGLSSPF